MKIIYLFITAILLCCLGEIKAQQISFTAHAIKYRNYNNNCDGVGDEEGRFFPEFWDNGTNAWTGCVDRGGDTKCDGDANGGGYSCDRNVFLRSASNSSATYFALYTHAYEDDGFTSTDCGDEDCACGYTSTSYNFKDVAPCGNRDIVNDCGGRWQITFRIVWWYSGGFSAGGIGGATTVCNGGSATLTNTVGGTTGPYIFYQWQSSPDNASWSDIPGANSATYTTPALTANTYYRRLVKANQSCNPYSVATSSVLVTVVPDPVWATNTFAPTSGSTICLGGSVTFSATVDNLRGGSVGWVRATTSGGAGTAVASPDVPPSTGTYYYRPQYTAGFSGCAASNGTERTVTVVADPTWATNTLAPTTVCPGGEVTFSASVSGGAGNSVSWVRSTTPGGVGSAVTSPNTEANAGTYYYRPIYTSSATGCNLADGTERTVTVLTPATAPTGATATDNTICLGGSSVLNATGGSVGIGADLVWYASAICPPFTQNWVTQPYSTPNSTVNSNLAGILNITSTTNDPMIDMAGIGSFDPTIYRYINIRYRVTSGTAGGVEIFFYNTSHNYAVGGETGYGTLISDNTWRTLTIDMWTDPDYLTGGNIQGWRYDWATASGVTMELDYINLSAAPPLSSTTVSPTSTTIYSVRYEGQCNVTSCVSTSVSVVPDPTAPTNTPSPAAGTVCVGAPLSVTASGSTGGVGTISYQYAIDPGTGTFGAFSTTNTVTPSSVGNGTYRIKSRAVATGSDCVSAETTTSWTVIADPIWATNTLAPTTLCAGGQVTFSASVSGGAGNSVSWVRATTSGGAGSTVTSPNTEPSAAVVYYRPVYTSSVPGCNLADGTQTTVTIVNDPTAPTNTPSPAAGTVCVGANLSITAAGSTGGSGAISYEYAIDPGTGSFGAFSTTNSVTASGTGTYRIKSRAVATGSGCVSGETITSWTVIADPTWATNTLAPTTLCAGGQVTFSASVSGGAGNSVSWVRATTSGGAGSTVTSPNTEPSAAVVYYRPVYTSSVAGCNLADGTQTTVTINALPTPAITGTATICSGNSTTLTASGGTGYAWSNGTLTAANTVAPTTNTTYTVTVTNGAGCTATASQLVTVNTLPTASISGTATICSGNSTTLTASGGTSYAWSNGTLTAANTVAPTTNTTYTVTVTNGAGCTATASQLVTVNTLPAASISGTATICSGNSTTLTASGGTSYAWSNGTLTAANTVAPTTNTTYTVTVTNGAGCTATASQLVTVNTLPTASISGTATICSGNSTTLTASGGTGYAWSNGTLTAANTVAPTTNTTYTVTVTSSAGCTATASVNVTVSAVPVVDAGNNIVSCTGTAAITMSGATSTGTYSAATWTGGGGLGTWSQNANPSLATFTPTAASGSFTATLTLTGSGGCSNASDTRTITWNSPIAGLSAAFMQNPICENQDVYIIADVTAGVVTSWNWSGPNSFTSSAQIATVSNAQQPTNEGTYTVTATNVCGTATFTTDSLNIHSDIVNLVVSYVPAICEGSTLALTATYNGSSTTAGDVTWNWSGPNGFTATGQSPTRANVTLADGGIYGVSAFNACTFKYAEGPDLVVDAQIFADADPNMLAAPGLDNGVIEACGTLVVNLQANNPSPGTGQWSLVPNTAPNSGSVVSFSPSSSASNVTVTYSQVDPLPVSFRWTITNGACPPNESDVRVIFDPAITASAQLAGCSFTANDSILVQVNASGGSGTLNFAAPTSGELRVDINSANKAFTVPMNGASHTFNVSDAFCTTTQTVTAPNGHPIDVAFSASVGSTVASCYQADFNKWTTYSDNTNGAVLSINDNGQNLGLVNVTVYKDAAVNNIAQSMGSATCQGVNSTAMQRHFMISAENALTAPVSLRVYFTDDELQALIASSQANDASGDACNLNDNIYDINGLYLTKYTGVGEDGDYSNNSPSGLYKVYGDATALPTQPDGPMAKSSGGFSSVFNGGAAHHYVELNVTEFSELWLHGSQNGTALPVEMIMFEAEAIDNSYIQLKWATILEINNNGFQIERSTDGITWQTTGWVDGNGNATVRHDYAFSDNKVEAGIRYYYRLKQIDNDGAYEYTGVVSAIITKQVTFTVKDFVPNPAVNTTNLVVLSNNAMDVEVNFYNVIGESVISSKLQLNAGSNMIPFNIENLAAGTYTAIVSSANEVYSKKIVILK